MTNAFLTKRAASGSSSRASTRTRVYVVTLVTFRAEI